MIAQVLNYEVWHQATDPEKLWQDIVKTHKVSCVSNMNQVEEFSVRKAYQMSKQVSFETLAQFSQ